jgi:curli biogenesis system outer membrane secretion channel CsgG
MVKTSVLLFTVLFAATAYAADEEEFDPITVNVADAINCKLDVPTYNSFVMSLDSDEDKGAARRGWKKIKGTNAFMDEWQLPVPILVTGTHSTSRVALTSSGMMAVLDLPDPEPLAKAEQIENAADPEALLKALVDEGSMTAAQARQIPRGNKFLGERTLVDSSEFDAKLDMTFFTTIKRTISNVSTHPGKTLYGCAYKIDFAEGKATKKPSD